MKFILLLCLFLAVSLQSSDNKINTSAEKFHHCIVKNKNNNLFYRGQGANTAIARILSEEACPLMIPEEIAFIGDHSDKINCFPVANDSHNFPQNVWHCSYADENDVTLYYGKALDHDDAVRQFKHHCFLTPSTKYVLMGKCSADKTLSHDEKYCINSYSNQLSLNKIYITRQHLLKNLNDYLNLQTETAKQLAIEMIQTYKGVLEKALAELECYNEGIEYNLFPSIPINDAALHLIGNIDQKMLIIRIFQGLFIGLVSAFPLNQIFNTAPHESQLLLLMQHDLLFIFLPLEIRTMLLSFVNAEANRKKRTLLITSISVFTSALVSVLYQYLLNNHKLAVRKNSLSLFQPMLDYIALQENIVCQKMLENIKKYRSYDSHSEAETEKKLFDFDKNSGLYLYP